MISIADLKRKYSQLNTPFKAAVWYIGVTVIDNAVSVLTQPFVNRILSVEEVGTCGVFTSWNSIINIIVTFYLFCGVLEVYITKNKEKSGSVVRSLCCLSLLITIFFYLLICLLMPYAVSITGLKSLYFHIMFLTIMSLAIIQFWSVDKRFKYAYKDYALLTVGVFFVKSVLSVAFAYFFVSDRVAGRLIGLCLPTVLVAIPIFIQILRKGCGETISLYWKDAIKFNIPLIPHYLANVLLASSDRIMIEKIDGVGSAGLYTVAYSFSSLALIVFSAVNCAYNPFSMNAIKEKNYHKLSNATEMMIIASMIFSVLLIYFAPEGLLLLGGKTYLAALPIIPILVIGIFTSSFYFIFSNVEFVNEKTKYIFPITAIGACVNIGLNYIFIPLWGYEVAAVTTVVGYIIIASMHYVLSYKIVGHNIYNMKHIVLLLGLFSFISIIAIPLYRQSCYVRYLVILVFLMGAIVFLYKKSGLLREVLLRK